MRILQASGIRGTQHDVRVVSDYIRQRAQALGEPPELRLGLVFCGQNKTMLHSEVVVLDPEGSLHEAVYMTLAGSPEDAANFIPCGVRAMIEAHAPEYIIHSEGSLSLQDACAELVRYWLAWPELMPGFDGRAALTLAELEAA